jgi:small-conductance mechanosensitive channel
MILESWSSVLTRSFQDLSSGVINFLPNLVVAILVFLVGWVVGMVLGKLASQLIRALKVDNALRSAGIEEGLQRAGFPLDSGAFVGGLVKWFIIIVFLVAALDVLGLTQVNAFLQQVVLLYLPQVIIAVLILLVSAVIAETMQHVVVGAAKAAEVSHAHFLGSVTRWAIWIFAILTALFQLGVAQPFVQTLFTGVVIALSLGVGLAFGLGGQQAASEYIDKLRKEFSHHKEGGG